MNEDGAAIALDAGAGDEGGVLVVQKTIEGDADKLELELLHDLYHGDYDTKQIIFLRDLYELLEKVIDRCRDAGNVILQVVLKHS